MHTSIPAISPVPHLEASYYLVLVTQTIKTPLTLLLTVLTYTNLLCQEKHGALILCGLTRHWVVLTQQGPASFDYIYMILYRV